MKRIKITLLSILLASPLLIPLQLVAAENPTPMVNIIHRNLGHLREGLSTNWSGYASLTNLTNPAPNSVTFAGGNWVVPVLICSSQTTYSSAWVGIDGYSDGTVEQLGTEHDCYRGSAQYYAWYEMYPKSMHTLSLPVRVGDNMHAEVSYLGNYYFKLTIANLTTGQSFSTTQRLKSQRTSAEWVVEAPSSWFGVLPLANFGTINLSSAQATINGHNGPINDPAWQNDQITMVTSSLTPKATPSSLDSGGTAFSVTWNHQ